MKHILPLLLSVISLAFIIKEDPNTFPIVNHTFSKGEHLEYKINFGYFTVGKANMKVYEDTYTINNRPCYKMDVFGKTSGAVDWVAKINDNWGAYIDTAALLPHISYRNIQENNYRKQEIVRFDHLTNLVETKVMNNETGEYKEPEYFQAPNNVRDMIAGYLYLRSVKFKKMRIGDTLKINAFFENTVYDFAIIYKGKEDIKTKVGTFRALKLVPIMPDNKLFSGENAITLWMSDDENRVPLKISANMVVGSVGCELVNYSGLKNEATFFRKK
ncbi:MAG: DUF3108 domain-containing protein [Bacteroidota bacterium]|nr:DUF3108 domain-containing protein [Bacteroidota bacterium]